MVKRLQLERQARFSIGDADETRYVNVAKCDALNGQRVFVATPALVPGERVDLSDVGGMGVDFNQERQTIVRAELPKNTAENHQARARILAMLAVAAFADHFTSRKDAEQTRIAVTPEAAASIGENELRELRMRRITRAGELERFSTSATRLHAYGAVMLRKTDTRMLPKSS